MNLAIIGDGEQGHELFNIIKSDIFSDKYENIYMVGLFKETDCIIKENNFFSKNSNEYEVLIAVGEPEARRNIFFKYKEKGYKFATYIHENAFVSPEVEIRSGSAILPFVYIAQNTIIDDNVLVHVGARIENDCRIGKNSMISSGAFIGAKTEVGGTTFLGPNSAIRDGIKIGENVIVGMSSCVLNSIRDKSVVVGNPAREIRENKTGKIF